jgi:hypothetical protein
MGGCQLPQNRVRERNARPLASFSFSLVHPQKLVPGSQQGGSRSWTRSAYSGITGCIAMPRTAILLWDGWMDGKGEGKEGGEGDWGVWTQLFVDGCDDRQIAGA